MRKLYRLITLTMITLYPFFCWATEKQPFPKIEVRAGNKDFTLEGLQAQRMQTIVNLAKEVQPSNISAVEIIDLKELPFPIEADTLDSVLDILTIYTQEDEENYKELAEYTENAKKICNGLALYFKGDENEWPMHMDKEKKEQFMEKIVLDKSKPQEALKQLNEKLYSVNVMVNFKKNILKEKFKDNSFTQMFKIIAAVNYLDIDPPILAPLIALTVSKKITREDRELIKKNFYLLPKNIRQLIQNVIFSNQKPKIISTPQKSTVTNIVFNPNGSVMAYECISNIPKRIVSNQIGDEELVIYKHFINLYDCNKKNLIKTVEDASNITFSPKDSYFACNINPYGDIAWNNEIKFFPIKKNGFDIFDNIVASSLLEQNCEKPVHPVFNDNGTSIYYVIDQGYLSSLYRWDIKKPSFWTKIWDNKTDPLFKGNFGDSDGKTITLIPGKNTFVVGGEFEETDKEKFYFYKGLEIILPNQSKEPSVDLKTVATIPIFYNATHFGIAVHPQEPLVIAYPDKKIESQALCIFDYEKQIYTDVLPLDPIQYISKVQFSPNGNALAIAGYSDRESTIKIWERTNIWRHTKTLSAKVDTAFRTIAFTPDGNSLVTGGKNEPIKIWNLFNKDISAEKLVKKLSLFQEKELSSIESIEHKSDLYKAQLFGKQSIERLKKKASRPVPVWGKAFSRFLGKK